MYFDYETFVKLYRKFYLSEENTTKPVEILLSVILDKKIKNHKELIIDLLQKEYPDNEKDIIEFVDYIFKFLFNKKKHIKEFRKYDYDCFIVKCDWEYRVIEFFNKHNVEI